MDCAAVSDTSVGQRLLESFFHCRWVGRVLVSAGMTTPMAIVCGGTVTSTIQIAGFQ
jgi:hypothetical protein